MAEQHKAGGRQIAAAAIALAAVGAALLAIGTPGGPPPARAGAACAGAEKPASEAMRRELRRTVRCLFNQQRAVRGLDALARNAALQKAAQRHSKVMGATDCLAHRCPGEAKLETRVRRAGYLDQAERWSYAENTGCGASALAMVTSWMASAYHRVNILEPDFRDLGVGVVRDRVRGRCARGFSTFAVVVGERERAK